MKSKYLAKCVGVLGIGIVAAASNQAQAVVLNTGLVGANILGDVIPGVNYGDYGGQAGGEQYMINTLIPMGLNTSLTDVNSVLFNRSGNTFSPLPLADLANSVQASGGGINFDGTYANITLVGTGYRYLVAKYDGPNGGAEVWDIAGLAAGTLVQVPEYAFGQQAGQYQMTGWGLFNPSTNPPPTVPDGGTTAFMLGAALGGLWILKRQLAAASPAYATQKA